MLPCGELCSCYVVWCVVACCVVVVVSWLWYVGVFGAGLRYVEVFTLCGVVWRCSVLWCAEGAITKGQRPGCLPTGKGKRAGLCVLCARCV